MSKPFDYSKWDKIELSDDEEDVHPNIDKDSWFRMKHRSRVEREEAEEKDKKKINAEMEKANLRIQVLEHDLAKLDKIKMELADDDDDDDDDDLDDREGILAEIKELKKANTERQVKLDDYEKNKTWNVDNLCHVAEERTIINSSAGTRDFTTTGYAKNTVKKEEVEETVSTTTVKGAKEELEEKKQSTTASEKKKETKKAAVVVPAGPQTAISSVLDDVDPNEEQAMDSYHVFTEKYADIVEEFMHLHSMDASKEFLLKHGDVLLQENASNYLLLASLEDEMNGYHDKMRLTARQSQVISNIAELAKSLKAHPGNVVIPFFQRLENPEMKAGFDAGVADFISKIQRRAVTKRMEMDAAQRNSNDDEQQQGEAVDLQEVPREERLGPGGLDPVEVMERLPQSMQDAFESRDVEQLKQALLAMEPQEAERLMKDCVDSGLWVQ